MNALSIFPAFRQQSHIISCQFIRTFVLMKFEEFKLHPRILEALSYMGFEKATPIQEKAIPAIMEGRDVLGTAQTGTGKTAAFILPVLNEQMQEHKRETNTLIIVPTRELALQIDQQIQGFAYFLPVTSAVVYGGGDKHDWTQQKKALTEGADIVVATPGKLLAHMNMGYVKFKGIKHFILDEADRMLDMGFLDDIKRIEQAIPSERQTLLFSATMPKDIRKLASSILKDPVEISFGLSKPAEGVMQAAYLTYDQQKIAFVKQLIRDKDNYTRILIFTSTKKKVGEIVRELRNPKYRVEGISSDLDQREREEVLMRFRAKKTKVLVATDVLSRGIDIKDINLVINFDVPQDAEDYVHRVGRTARAETTGVAITLINPADMHKFSRIEKLIERDLPKLPVPQELGPSPEWGARSQGGGRNFRNKGRRPGHGRK